MVVSDDKLTSMLVQTRMKFMDKAKSDVKLTLSEFTDLNPGPELYTFPDKTRRNVLALTGTIPINYKGNRYHIPVALHLMDNHPYAPPFVHVKPTPQMAIRESEHVDHTGRVFLPYLNEWRYPQHDTVGLIQVLIFAFQDKCPVFSKSSSGPTPPQRTPYPDQSHQPPYPIGSGVGFSMPAPSVGYPSPSINASPYQTPYPAYTNVPMPTPPTHMPPAPPPPPPQHAYASSIRASLLSAIEQKIANRMKQKLGGLIEDTQRLDICLNDMRIGQQKLRSFMEKSEKDQRDLDLTLATYKEKQRELEESLQKYSSSNPDNQQDDIDSAIEPKTPLHRQIFENYAIDLTMDDLIYHLTDALKKHVITIQVFLTYTRMFSRKKFVANVAMNKGREVAGLPAITE
uniref:UEV domain-containing protein n=1 Tax=Panagrellus redivivus TaxID=6233 RepID=A0A7E5A0A2_PANRE